MAHIIAASDTGPRGDPRATAEELRAYDNLILLCSNCHTIIDKAPDEFPITLIRDWKASHKSLIASAIGAIRYDSRELAREAVAPILRTNRAVFKKWGPDNDYRFDPESEHADTWKTKMASQILPNNRKLLSILDANSSHLNPKELSTLESFRDHVDDLENKHFGDHPRSTASRFPEALSDILT